MSPTETTLHVYNSAVQTAKSSLKPDNIKTLKENLDTLKYLEGSGMTERQKLRIRNDTAYLLIGLGGQGIEKLRAVRRQLHRDCNPEDIRNYVRFLAVDTDLTNLRQLNFLPTETAEIRPGVADQLADPNSPQFLSWIHPELNIHITGLQSSFGWSSPGANQNRQVGRVKLADPENRENLTNKARNALLSILNNRTIQTVRVIIIAGLAGGTGSGTVVDIPYLIREKVNKQTGTGLAVKNFIVEGYLLLPPACGKESGAAAASGNRNAYAALKEIDYYMTLKEMHDANPQAEYRFCGIRSIENIFDTCTLVDGMFADGGAVQDPSKLASETIAHTIVTALADVTAKDERGNDRSRTDETFFGSASYNSNMRAIAETQLMQADYTQCPRESNYRFLSCGYAEVIVPVDLMALYVANKVFKRIWEDYNKAFTINDKVVDNFLERAGLTVRAIRDELSRGGDAPGAKLPKRALTHMSMLLKQNGPYYMINLLHDTVDRLSYEYIENQRRSNRGLWSDAKNLLNRYREYLKELQHQDYAVYTVVIEQLQMILENDANILTDSKRHQETFRETFYWTPIDLSSADRGQVAIKEYLDDLLSEQDVEQMANKFRDELVEKRDYWVDVFEKEGKFDAADRIRTFIKDSIGNKVNASVEDFLVKLYSEDKKASVANNDQDEALTLAASNIYNYFDSHSAPLAYMDSQNIRLFSDGLRNFILPESTKNIAKKLMENHNIDPKNIYFGNANDRLICITMYGAVPAFFYRWVRDGESAYEQDVNAVGLHMDQTGGKERGGWADLPNLIPRVKKLREITQRERTLYDEAEKLLDRADRYQLATPAPGDDSYCYQLRILKDNPHLEPGKSLFEAAKETVAGYIEKANYPFSIGKERANLLPGMDSAHNLVDDMIIDCGVLSETQLKYGTWSLKPGGIAVCAKMNAEEKAAYTKDLAVKLLCKSLDMKRSLQQAVDLAAYFENDVSKRNADFAFSHRKAERLDIFRKLLVSDVIRCEDSIWEYTVDAAPRTLVSYTNEQTIARQFNLYLAYLKFVNLPDSIYEEVKDYYEKDLPKEQRAGSFIENNRNRWYLEIERLTGESDRKRDYAMRNESFPQKVKEADWRDPFGKVITADEIVSFYTGMKRALQPTTPARQTAVPDSSIKQTCPTCGKAGIDVDVKFCPECGAKLGQRLDTQTWICSKCGKAGIAADVKFCPECGTKRSVAWICPECGKNDIANDFKFCPECGCPRP